MLLLFLHLCNCNLSECFAALPECCSSVPSSTDCTDSSVSMIITYRESASRWVIGRSWTGTKIATVHLIITRLLGRLSANHFLQLPLPPLLLHTANVCLSRESLICDYGSSPQHHRQLSLWAHLFRSSAAVVVVKFLQNLSLLHRHLVTVSPECSRFFSHYYFITFLPPSFYLQILSSSSMQ